MHLKLEALQQVVKRTKKEEQIREELFKAFGPAVNVSNKCSRVAEAANEQLDYFEATGRSFTGSLRTSVLVEAARSASAPVRKIAARLLPARMIVNLLDDRDSSVRCAAAKRLPYKLVRESYLRNPIDDQMHVIMNEKRLAEAGVPNPKTVDEPFDMYGDEPLGDAVKSYRQKDMPDTWYERLAHKCVADYGSNIEGQWEEVLASRIASSYYATSGVRLDREKLLDHIHKTIRAREDAVLGEGSLSSIKSRLLEESYLDRGVMPVIEENYIDPVAQLLRESHSSASYVDAAEKLFNVRKSSIPAGIKKYRLGEGYTGETRVPMKASIPSGSDSVAVEKALDAYVGHWNKQQAMSGEPYKLSWSHYPTDINLVGFNLELK